MTRKILVLLAVVMFIGNVIAYSTVDSLGTKGTGTAVISTDQAYSATHSAKLFAPFDNSNGPEGRVHIDLIGDFTLNDLNSFSWMQYVTQGYITHVDVLLDVGNDGNIANDNALVFEYDKVTAPSDQLLVDMAFHTNQWVNTFDDKGIVDGNAVAWLNSGAPGAVSSPNFIEASLNQWKAGNVGTNLNSNAEQSLIDAADAISGSTKIKSLEIEVDGWVAQSEAYVDNIMLNGNLIENFEGSSQTVNAGVAADIQLLPTPNPLNFGSTLIPGQTSTQAVTLTPGTSNIDVSVTITGASFIQNMLSDRTGSWTSYNGDSFELFGGTPSAFNTQITVPVGTISGSYSGTITYTVLEHI